MTTQECDFCMRRLCKTCENEIKCTKQQVELLKKILERKKRLKPAQADFKA